MEDQRVTRAEVVYAAAMKDARINACINKSLVQALESCLSSDVTPPAVLPTLVSSPVEIRKGQLA